MPSHIYLYVCVYFFLLPLGYCTYDAIVLITAVSTRYSVINMYGIILNEISSVSFMCSFIENERI